MRIGCLQFAPHVGDTENNLNRADAVLSKANLDDLDLLVLPELAFSGYNFKSLQDITPFLEPSGSGITSLWARTMALKYNCIVTVGYPEKVDVSPKWPTGPEYYNSAIVVNEDGETIANYRKRFLYYTDESWALEGNQGFYEGFIPGLGNTSMGICMDINPYKFEAPWHAFEFAFHVLEMESNLVILSMAWMTREDRRQFTRMPNEPDMETLTYWVTRLEPLIRSDNQDEIIVVFCNRTGIEDEATYAGTSAVVGIRDGEVTVYGLLGRGEKELLVVDTNASPYAKLVYRPSQGGVATKAATLQSSAQAADTAPPDSLPGDSQRDTSAATSTNGRSPSSTTSTVGSNVNERVDSSRSDPRQANGVGGTAKRRPAPPIQVPNPSEFIHNGDAGKSPTSGGLVIPTPSAPSPTPMTVRPKLIIPESPPIQPYQYPADHPISASSLRSDKSLQSVKSYESEASTQTIRSNPRPPEESTPYPHSGAPLSGYPDNSWQDEGKWIYGGNVTILHQYEHLSPTTPFEDTSPASTHHFWRPSENLLRTASAGAWTPGTPIGKRPEPFPWSAITEAAQPATKTETPPPKYGITASDDLVNGCLSPKSNASSNRTNKSARSGSTSVRSESTRSKSKRSSEHDKKFERPPSPKSRNASRSGMNGRSNSSLGEREASAAVAMHLEGIAHRAESANSMRKASASATPVPDRPESPKSRNCSRNRNDGGTGYSQVDPHSIPIAASPSIFRGQASTPEARGFYRPWSRAATHQRSNSITNVDSQSNHGPAAESDILRPASRVASRGRQPGPQDLPSSEPQRSTSRDSTRNDRLHTRTSRRASSGRNGGPSSRNGRRSSNQHQDLSHFQRVEAVVCPNCPVHGRRQSSASGCEMHSVPAESSQNTASSGDAPEPQSTDANTEQTLENPTPQMEEKPKTERDRAASQASHSTSGETEVSDWRSSADTLQTVSSSERSPATPSLYDPPTPKAMVLDPQDELAADSILSAEMTTAADIPPARCADDTLTKSSEIPTTVA